MASGEANGEANDNGVAMASRTQGVRTRRRSFLEARGARAVSIRHCALAVHAGRRGGCPGTRARSSMQHDAGVTACECIAACPLPMSGVVVSVVVVVVVCLVPCAVYAARAQKALVLTPAQQKSRVAPNGVSRAGGARCALALACRRARRARGARITLIREGDIHPIIRHNRRLRTTTTAIGFAS